MDELGSLFSGVRVCCFERGDRGEVGVLNRDVDDNRVPLLNELEVFVKRQWSWRRDYWLKCCLKYVASVT